MNLAWLSLSAIIVAIVGELLQPPERGGALRIAALPVTEDPKALFNKLMIWGLSTAVVGAIVCSVLFGLLRIP